MSIKLSRAIYSPAQLAGDKLGLLTLLGGFIYNDAWPSINYRARRDRFSLERHAVIADGNKVSRSDKGVTLGALAPRAITY